MSQPPADAIEIEQAKRNAAIAKARVQTTAGALKVRLNPRNLAADAVESVKEKTALVGDKAGDLARRRPAVVSLAAGLATLIIFRKPVKKLGRRLFSRRDKEERRALKLAERVAKRDAKVARARRRNKAAGRTLPPPPDNLIPHAAATEAGAAPAKQE